MSTFVQDTFTDSDGTALTSHTGEVGATWSTQAGYGVPTITGNRARGSGSGSDWRYGVASGTGASADYTLTADFVSVTYTGGTSGITLLGRLVHNTETYYYAGWDLARGWFVAKAVSGSYTTLGQSAFTPSGSTTYALSFDLSGTTLTLTVDGVQKVQVTDSAISAINRVGFYVDGSGASTGPHLDNFLAADATAADRCIRRRRAGIAPLEPAAEFIW